MSRQILKGSTNVQATLRALDSTDGTPEEGIAFNTAGISLWYRRQGAVKTAITPVTLSLLSDAHSDGGVLHIDDGLFRVDVPDAAFATGADHVVVGGTATGMVFTPEQFQLVDFDPQNANTLGLSAFYVGAPKKNTAYSGALVFVLETTAGAAATGKTPTVVRSIDGAASAAVNGATVVTEIGGGRYALTAIAAVDLNGDSIGFTISASGCKDVILPVYTTP